MSSNKIMDSTGQRPRWSQIIDINVKNGTKQQRLSLLEEIIATGDRYLLAEYLIELMIVFFIGSTTRPSLIHQCSFLASKTVAVHDVLSEAM